MKKIQCKDIPEEPILKFLDQLNGRWANWFSGDFDNSVQQVFPEDTRGTKLVLAKMRQMIKKGLVDGCPCGCRGDFVITEKGKNKLDKHTEGNI